MFSWYVWDRAVGVGPNSDGENMYDGASRASCSFISGGGEIFFSGGHRYTSGPAPCSRTGQASGLLPHQGAVIHQTQRLLNTLSSRLFKVSISVALMSLKTDW